jgi:ABC-2 type transport system permease protein
VTVALRAETRKLLTTQVWWWMALLTAALSILFASLISAFTDPADAGVPIEALLNITVTFAMLISSVLGVIGITGEYRHLTVTPTFLGIPRRGTVVGAKLVTYLVTGLAIGVLAVVLSVAIGAPWLNARGIDVDLGASSTVRIMIAGVIATGIWGVIGVGVGTLLRNQVAAVVGIVLYRFIIEGILSGIPKVKEAYPYLPGGATNALLSTVDPNVNDGSLDLLSPWLGGLLLLAYGLVFAVLGLMLTVRRDVT